MSDAAFTGSIPQTYDQGLGPVLFEDFARNMAGRAAALKPSRVLETAAGTGIVTRQLRDALPPETQLTATDLNPPMLDLARAKFRDGEAVELKPADAQELPFADGAFDLMVCQFGIMFYPDKPLSLAEAFRVLEPGGHYLFSVWDSHRYNRYAAIVQALLEEALPVDTPGFYHVPFSCSALDPIKAMLLDAGFGEIRLDVLTIDKRVDDMAAFANAMIRGNPLIGQLQERGVDPQAMIGTLLGRMRQTFGDNGPVPLHTMTWQARKPV